MPIAHRRAEPARRRHGRPAERPRARRPAASSPATRSARPSRRRTTSSPRSRSTTRSREHVDRGRARRRRGPVDVGAGVARGRHARTLRSSSSSTTSSREAVSGPRIGHPHRAAGEGPARPVPHRRRAPRDHAQSRSRCSSRSSAASRSWRTWTSPSRASRRTATAPSRSTATSSTSASRRCPPSTASASSCVSCARTRSCCGCPTSASSPRRLERFESSFTQAVRRDPRHGTDRFGQVDDAVRGDQRAQRSRPAHHHGRGPGRVPAARREPDPDEREGGPDVRAARCGPSCAARPTSSSSARSATRRRPRSRSSPRSPATSCSPRCTRTTRPRRVTRLIEMGVEPFLVASAVDCVLGAASRAAAVHGLQGGVPAEAAGALDAGYTRGRPARDALPRRRAARSAATPATVAGWASTRSC